jgi:hypothetical protein
MYGIASFGSVFVSLLYQIVLSNERYMRYLLSLGTPCGLGCIDEDEKVSVSGEETFI